MNLKSIIINALITSILFVGYHFLFNSKSNALVYVDTSKLMVEYKGMAEVKKIIEGKAKVWQATVDTLTLELQNDIKKYEKERGQMSEREKKTTEQLLGHKQQQFMQYKEASKNKVVEEEQKITNEALVKVNNVISDYGKTKNYTIVLGTVTGNIVYADQTINITDQILEVLNIKYDQDKK